MAYLIRSLIKLYQLLVSPMLGSCCRFYPSCSEYALEAFSKRPLLHAFWLVLKRIACCGPWHPGGVDFLTTPSPSTLDQNENV